VIQALLKIYKGRIPPNSPTDLLAGDELARMAGQKGEDLERLRREVDEDSGLEQFSALEV